MTLWFKFPELTFPALLSVSESLNSPEMLLVRMSRPEIHRLQVLFSLHHEGFYFTSDHLTIVKYNVVLLAELVHCRNK
jgi:hypothetical protein